MNKLGGVDVNVERSFCDPRYSEYGYERGFAIKAGRHHLNGNQALAYARVRKAAGESDFTRAARQQEVLSGMRDQIERGGFINDPIGLLKAIGKTVRRTSRASGCRTSPRRPRRSIASTRTARSSRTRSSSRASTAVARSSCRS